MYCGLRGLRFYLAVVVVKVVFLHSVSIVKKVSQIKHKTTVEPVLIGHPRKMGSGGGLIGLAA